MAKVGGYVRTDFKLAGDFDLWSRLHTELYGITSPLGGFANNQRGAVKCQYVIEEKNHYLKFENY